MKITKNIVVSTICILLFIFFSCKTIKGAIDAQIIDTESGKALKGPSILQMEGKFV